MTLILFQRSGGETAKLQIELARLPDMPDEPTTDPPQVGDTALGFTLPHINGELISLSDYRGVKTVLLSFHRGQF